MNLYKRKSWKLLNLNHSILYYIQYSSNVLPKKIKNKSTPKISYNNKTSKSQSLNFLLWILHHKQLKCQTQSHLGKKNIVI